MAVFLRYRCCDGSCCFIAQSGWFCPNWNCSSSLMFCVSICNVISVSLKSVWELWVTACSAPWASFGGGKCQLPFYFHFICLSIVVGTHSKKLHFPVLACISADHFCKQPRRWQHRVVEADLGWLCKIRGKTTCINLVVYTSMSYLEFVHFRLIFRALCVVVFLGKIVFLIHAFIICTIHYLDLKSWSLPSKK